jgi:hypothetical protein
MADKSRNALGPAKRKLRETVEQLEAVRVDLLSLVGGLPLPASANDQTDLGTLSDISEVDALVRCSIHDHLDPLLASLRSVARVRRNRHTGHPHRSRRDTDG